MSPRGPTDAPPRRGAGADPGGDADVAGEPGTARDAPSDEPGGVAPDAAGDEPGSTSHDATGDEGSAAAQRTAEEVLFQSPLLYRLVRTPERRVELEAVVGGIAQYAVRLPLDEAELLAWTHEGPPFLDRLARALLADPHYCGRARPA